MNPAEFRELWQRAPLPLIIIALFWAFGDTLSGPAEMRRQQADQDLRSHTTTFRGTRLQKVQQLRQGEINRTLAAGLQRIERWLPPRDSLPLLIEQLHQTAALFGVEVKVARYARSGSSEEPAGPTQLTLDLELQARYPGLRAFLTALEGLPFPVLPLELVAQHGEHYSLRLLQIMRAK